MRSVTWPTVTRPGRLSSSCDLPVRALRRGQCRGPFCRRRGPFCARAVELSDDRLQLVVALRRLPAAQREAIALHYLADLPVHEVAATVGASVGTVKSRLSRGRTALAVLLREQDHDPATAPQVRHA
jgi:DNA-directed RNA polymerase specialized sigma24 family protein